MSELTGKKVKIVNIDGFQNDDNYELYLYLEQTGIINDYKTTIHRFTIKFDDELMENIDFDNDKLLFAIDNVEFIDEKEVTLPNSNNNLQNIIKQMLNVIGDYEGNKISLNIWTPNEMCIYVYDSEIPVVINVKNKYVYIDTDTMDHHLTSSMLDELCQIVKIIDDNIDVILECL